MFGPYHSLTALSLTNLGDLLRAQGDYEAARQSLEQAVAIHEQITESKDHQFVTLLNNLAIVYQAQGKHDLAHSYFEVILEVRERDFGTTHPLTIIALSNLAVSFKYLGNYAAARPLLERVLVISEQIYGPDHPATASTLGNLAGLLNDNGDHQAARPLLERAVTILERTLGPNHPDTARGLSNLGSFLQDQGDYEAARPLLERAFTINEQTLGPNHPSTAISLNNLAEFWKARGDYITARQLIERAVAIFEQVLGPDHPSTKTSFNNLVRLLNTQGDFEIAQTLVAQKLARVLGPSHPLLAVRFNTFNWQLVEITSQRLVWENDFDDQFFLTYSDLPPDIRVDPFDLNALREFYRGFACEANMGIVSVDHVSLGTMFAIQTIFKVPQQPHGMNYIGSYILPNATFSYVIEVRAAEHGTTGLRDSLVLNEFLSDILEMSTDGPILRGWFQDPYNPTYTEGILRNKSEDAKYDDQFPDHPLSRVRRYLANIAQGIMIDEVVKNAPLFRGPVTGRQKSTEQRRPWWKCWRK